MIYIGIDWADREHHIFITNDLGANLGSFAITHSVEGFAKLEDRVKGLSSDQKECLFALEIASGLLMGYLLAKGYTVYPINPKAVDRYRDRYRVSGAKSDPGDAMVLAHILRTDRHCHQPLMPPSELARELLLLTRDHQNLAQSNTPGWLTSSLLALKNITLLPCLSPPLWTNPWRWPSSTTFLPPEMPRGFLYRS